MFRIDKEARERVNKEFGKTEEKVLKDVAVIKNWMENQDLPEIMEDPKIRNFLQLNKFDLERTKERIEYYYSVRRKIPSFFTGGNPKLPNIQKVFDTTYCSIHPKTIDGMHRVIFLKMKEPNTFTPNDLVKLCLSIFEVRLYEDCMVNDIILFDLSNLTFRDMTKISPQFIIHAFKVYKNVFSLRLKALHFLNSPIHVSVWMALMKFLLKPKIFDRVQVHRGVEVVQEIFSNEECPKEYGGGGPSLEELNEMWKEKLKEYQDRFDKMDTLIEDRKKPN